MYVKGVYRETHNVTARARIDHARALRRAKKNAPRKFRVRRSLRAQKAHDKK